MIDSKSDDSDASPSESESRPEGSPKVAKKPRAAKVKIVMNVSDCQYPVVSKVGKHFGWKIQSTADTMEWDVYWTDNAVQPETLTKMQLHQKINHFPGMYNLARKNLLGRGLMRMKKQFPNDFNFFPMTWTLPIQYHQLKTYFQAKAKGKARTFIVKPECMSQGKGIFITRKLDDIQPGTRCVVQRYLHRPYLIEGLKFDLRIYVLVASVDPLSLYLYHQGLGRFATQKYEAPNKDNMQETCMHLTNYAINKNNPNFQFNTSEKDMSHGHKRSLTAVYSLLQANGVDVPLLKSRISDAIIKTIISGLPHLTNTYRSCQPQSYSSNMCFELLGFDVMLTDKADPIVLEVNHTPSFTTDTPLDNFIKFGFIKDSLNLMNINQKSRNQVVKQQKEACQLRVTTGKKPKLTAEEREVKRRQSVKKKMKYQLKNIGELTRIYPPQGQDNPYLKFIQFAQQNFQNSLGAKKGKKVQKAQEVKSIPVKIKRPPVFSTTPDLNRKHIADRKYQSKTRILVTNQSYNKQGCNQSSHRDKSTVSVGLIDMADTIQNQQGQRIADSENINNNVLKNVNSHVSSHDVFIKDLQTPCARQTPKPVFPPSLKKTKQIQIKSGDIYIKTKSAFQKHVTDEPEIGRFRQQKAVKTYNMVYPENRPQTGKGYPDGKTQMFNNFTREGEFKSLRKENDRRASREKDKLYSKNSLQKEKIPINLNTLLINGLEKNQPLVSNLKKFMINRQKTNE